MSTLIVGTFLAARLSFAQETGVGVAFPANIAGNPIEGSLVCSGSNGYFLCNSENDGSIFGVVVTTPSSSFGELVEPNERFVISSGIVKVRVSNQNGDIQSGDLLSPSSIEGVAQKATKNGFVLGNALGSSNEVGSDNLLFVSLNIHYTTSFTESRSSLLEILREGLRTPVLTPLAALRYIVAAGVVLISFGLAFIYFGRLAKSAVEGVARNPLARGRIEFVTLVNILITIGIFVTGLILAYLILAI